MDLGNDGGKDFTLRILDAFVAIASLIGLIFIGWWGVYGGPDNALVLQQKLQKSADAAVAEAHDWARVTVDGQRAEVTGAPPSPEALADALDAVLTSSGEGGIVFGGIVSVSAATVLPSDQSSRRRRYAALQDDRLNADGFASENPNVLTTVPSQRGSAAIWSNH